MMDLSSVIDAGLVVAGTLTVLLMGLWTLSAESSTVSTSTKPSTSPIQRTRQRTNDRALPKAA